MKMGCLTFKVIKSFLKLEWIHMLIAEEIAQAMDLFIDSFILNIYTYSMKV